MAFDIRKVTTIKESTSPMEEIELKKHDFGFTALSEEKLRENEEALRKKVEEQEAAFKQQEEAFNSSSKTAVENLKKLHKLRDKIMILLTNLCIEPKKEYLLWPNRLEQVKTFSEEINKIVDGPWIEETE